MNWSEAVPAIAWLLIGLSIAIGAHSLGLGGLNNPGAGLFAFIVGVGIAALSASLIVTTVRQPTTSSSTIASRNSYAVIAVIVALAFYALTLERIGFFICTVLFLFGLFVILGRKAWLFALTASVLVATASYCVFVWALKINLPAGPLGF